MKASYYMKEWERHLDRAEEKLRSASILLEHKMFADVISEAYYSMFHAAKALLAVRGLFSKTHVGVISQFGLQFVNEGLIEEWYAKSLTKAQSKREKADYDIFYEPSNEEAESVLEDAEKFLERIQLAVRELTRP
ncbi:MAG: HEPN domain-containing protein [Candidatus Methanospirareceae archaeon]